MASVTRFLVLSHEVTWVGSVATIVVTTNVECHLTCRYTYKPLLVHNSANTARGVRVLDNPDYCFTSFREVEQDQAGDTTIHTFSFGEFGQGEERWWVFVGSIAGVVSVSQSPVFNYKYESSPVYSIGILGESEALVGTVVLEAGDGVNLSYLSAPGVGITIKFS